MIKKILILYIIPIAVFGQLNSKFIYTIKVVDNKDSKMMELMESLSPYYKDKVKNIEFTLLTDNYKSSCFTINKETIPDDDGVKLFITMTEYTGQINQVEDSLFVEKNQDYLEKKITVKDTINKKWTITKDSKEIMGYKCYKATSEKIVINSVGIFKNDVIAWFCPQLPYQFGPMGYGKLPGLIFELQTKYALFGIKNILINKENQICKPNKKNVFIDALEFEGIVQKSIENKRAMMRK
jgi:GLPGLI family protein